MSYIFSSLFFVGQSPDDEGFSLHLLSKRSVCEGSLVNLHIILQIIKTTQKVNRNQKLNLMTFSIMFSKDAKKGIQ